MLRRPVEIANLRRAAGPLALLAGVLLLGACARSSHDATPRRLNQTYSQRLVTEGQTVPRGGGAYKIGAPYQIKGQWYHPREEPGYVRQGIASWYGSDFHGRKTANGEVYDMNAVTAAHPTLPIPSYAHVTNLETGRTVLVRINDRGPYANDRIIDLSRQSARLLGFQDKGMAKVRVTYAGPAPLDGDASREHRFLAQQSWYRSHYARSGPANGTIAYKQSYGAVSPRPPQRPWGLGAPALAGEPDRQ